MAKRQKQIMLTTGAANLMVSIAASVRGKPDGVPCKIADTDAAMELERAGMIERVHVGSSCGAIPTKLGKRFVEDAVKHLRAMI